MNDMHLVGQLSASCTLSVERLTQHIQHVRDNRALGLQAQNPPHPHQLTSIHSAMLHMSLPSTTFSASSFPLYSPTFSHSNHALSFEHLIHSLPENTKSSSDDVLGLLLAFYQCLIWQECRTTGSDPRLIKFIPKHVL